MRLERTREFGTEIHLAHLGPTGNDTVTFNGTVVHQAYLALDNVVGTLTGIIGFALVSASV